MKSQFTVLAAGLLAMAFSMNTFADNGSGAFGANYKKPEVQQYVKNPKKPRARKKVYTGSVIERNCVDNVSKVRLGNRQIVWVSFHKVNGNRHNLNRCRAYLRNNGNRVRFTRSGGAQVRNGKPWWGINAI